MYTYTNLISQFRKIMRDPSSLNNKYFTDTEILEYFADATNEIVRETGLSVFTRSKYVRSGESVYSTDTRSMKIMDVRNSDGEKIYQTTVEHLESNNTRWRDDTGDITHYILERGQRGFQFRFYKEPTAAEKITYQTWRLPVQGSDVAVGDNPELDTAIVKLTMAYVLAQGYLKQDERTKYEQQLTIFEKVNIPKVKKYLNRFDDGIPRLASNEDDTLLGMGRLPDNYPTRYRR